MDKDLRDEYRRYAWEYFVLHAHQRMTVFNYYIVIASLLLSGYFATVLKETNNLAFSGMLSLLLIGFSIVFLKLDHRNKMLVRNAERALKYLDEKSGLADNGEIPHELKLFAIDDYETANARNENSFFNIQGYLSYSDCFRYAYLLFVSIGVGGLVLSIWLLWES